MGTSWLNSASVVSAPRGHERLIVGNFHGVSISFIGHNSSLLGNEYLIESPKRESGFTIFYMGITTGIILGTTLPSYLSKHFGWSTAFASATIGMIIAFMVFRIGITVYKIKWYTF